MSYYISVYDWSLYTLPSAIPMTDIEGDTHSNHPDTVDYNPAAPSWIGETFTFNGGSSTLLEINDDDDDFEDAYVETGGAQTLAQDVTIGTTTYLAGSVVENEFSMLDASGNEVWVVRIDGVNVGFAYPAGQDPTPGQTFVGDVGRDGDPADSSDGVGSIEPYKSIICFAEGTVIATPDGDRLVERLRPGDRVSTLDFGAQPVLWIGRTEIPGERMHANVQPVLIAPDSLGAGVPRYPLRVSPQHRVLLRGELVRRMFEQAEVLAPAKGLLGLPGVRQMKGKKSVTYFHLLLPRHSIISADGAATESFYPGPCAMEMLNEAQRREVRAIISGTHAGRNAGYGRLARPSISVRQAERFARRLRALSDNALHSAA